MDSYEYSLRAMLLLIGFVVILTGAGLAKWSDREVTPLVLIGIGFMCLAGATTGVW